jgi:hypothetical protein
MNLLMTIPSKVLVFLICILTASASARGESASAPSGKIVEENAKAGTRDWLLDKPRIDPASRYRCPWIEGYCSKASVSAGGTIQFHVSTNPASEFTLDIYRLGYYGGTGGRLMVRLGPFPGQIQPTPELGEKRLRNCQWPVAATWTVPADAVSGVYLGKLTAAVEGVQSYVIFIVKDDRKADFLFQCSDNTWHAYNRWPDRGALYDDGKNEWYWGGNVQVSFNRPYGKYCQILDQPLSTGSGEFLLWEYPFAYWMEQHGYDVSYISNTDTHQDGAGLLRAKGFLSIGHDEYWTQQMYNHAQAAIAAGVNFGFFSGNAVCGKIAWDAPQRAFERIGVFGPPGGTIEFAAMSSLKHERPYANELMGAHSTGPVTGGADWVCAKPEHWIFAGTEMKQGDGIPGLVGWEWHGDPAKIPGLEIVATAPTQSAPGKLNGGNFTATVYPGPKGNFVFNAATCWWADSLSAPPGYVRPSVYTSPQGPNAKAQRITQNILDRMRK